jgi:hypothetical protein
MTMETQANLGYLALLEKSNGDSPETFGEIAEVTNIPGFGALSDLVEVTHLQSPNGAKEYISGLDDGVELAITANLRLDHASQSPSTGLIADQFAKARQTFRLSHPEWGGFFDFQALVRGFTVDIQPNVAQVANFTLKITGGINWNEGTPA